MKRLYASLILFLYYFPLFGQIAFNQLPHDLQLYPRNTSNTAIVPISGTVTNTGFTKVGAVVLREGQLSQLVSQTLSPTATSPAFSLTMTIKAEPAEYAFQVFLYKDADSSLVTERKRVVCGDVFVLYGQSNAGAGAGLEAAYSTNFNDKYLRNCTFPYGSTNIPAEMRWYAAKDPFASVGGFGLTLQRLILQTYGIPTVILNGAEGGKGITALSYRDPNNHADLSPLSYYGRLLYRVRWAGVDKNVKAIIWKQGEDEAGNGPEGYDAKFKILYDQLRDDYGNVKLYVSQLNILAERQPGAAALRDFQRRTKYLFNNVETIATIGAELGPDGVHYTVEGHQRLAFEQFRQIARDFYGSTDTLQINSPDIRKVFYNPRKDSITLVYDDQMQMVWKDTAYYNFATGEKLGSRDLKDVFYLDEQAGLLASGSASGNRVKLALKQPSTARTLRYLPAFFSDALSPYYNGTTLRNTRGMRAFSFDNVPIVDAITTVTTLVARGLTEKQIQLAWPSSTSAQTQIIERADGAPTNFRQIATLTGAASTYVDNDIPDPMGTYFYRLRGFSDISEGVYSNIASAKPLILGLEPTRPLVRMYPNPLTTDRQLRIEAEQMTFTSLTVRDLVGRAVMNWSGRVSNVLSVALNGLESGLYVADIQTVDGQMLRQKLIVH